MSINSEKAVVTEIIARQTYPRVLRLLHWTIVALVIVQWLSSSWMESFVDDTEVGTLPNTLGSQIHMVFGATILVLMAGRFLVRMSYGTPPLPSDLPYPMRVLARLNHFAFYVVLVLLPLSGVAALFFARDFSAVHLFLKNVLVVIIGLHVAGVAFHMMVLRDGLLWRMVARPARD